MKCVGALTILATAACGSALAQPSAANTTTPLAAKNGSSHASVQWTACRVPSDSPSKWWYNNRNDGPYECYGPDYNSWSMLNSYRSGGAENVHWKYTDNVNDPECLNYWSYYAEDGRTLYAKINGRTTMERDSRRWCALPVYRTGGVYGFQWDECVCWEE